MTRWNKLALVVAVVAPSVSVVVACSKADGNSDKVAATPSPAPAGDSIATPKLPSMGGMGPVGGAVPAGSGAPTAETDRFKLKPEEGKLAIEVPADAKAGSEAIAKITVTPGAGYHVNTEYPIKLTLTPPTGVTLPKAEFAAGGHDKGKGDADSLDEKQLAISVKLTPAASGSYTINGSFKFAVCDKDQCLAKKETIAIAVAAK